MKLDGGALFVRVLKQARIDTVFTLHGGHLDSIFQAALDAKIRLVDTRHEQAAGHAADGWARTTGRPGVAIVTAGPGFTDVVTAIANAHLDCVPTLFVAGAPPLRDAESLPLQGGFDQLAVVTPIAKWAHRVTHTEQIPDLVAQALRIATTGRPGPVFLEIPIDVLFHRVEAERVSFPEKIFPDAAPAPAPEAVLEALEWLRDAERPAILAGGGAWFSGGASELLAFAELSGTPVFANSKAQGIVPAQHALCGRDLRILSVAARSGVGSADVVLVLGARMGFLMGGRGAPLIPKSARVIQVDIAAEEIGRNRRVDLGIAADCREMLRALIGAGKSLSWPDRSHWQRGVQAARKRHLEQYADALANDAPPLHPYRLAHEVMRALPENAIIVADGGETANWMETVAEVNGGGHWMSLGYFGCLGTGMPFAIAAKLAHPDCPVLCMVGDGSVGLNFAEFDTMVRHRLPIVTVVNNDRLWGMSAHYQDLIYGRERRVVSELGAARYDQAAAAFGCHAEYVEDPGELAGALSRALASDRPACVNVLSDPSVISPVTIRMAGAPKRPSAKAADAASSGDGVRIPYYDPLESQ